MSRGTSPGKSVRDSFALSQPQLHVAVSAVAATTSGSAFGLAANAANVSPSTISSLPALPLPQPRDFTPSTDLSPTPGSPFKRFVNLLHRYSLGVFALLFLLVASAGIEVGGRYYSAHIINSIKPTVAIKAAAPTVAGLNLTVPANDLQAKLQTITSQPATLTVGGQAVPIGADTIRSWLQITSSKDKSENYIRIKAGTIAASLTQLANQFVKAPVNQISVTAGGVTDVVVGGQNGTALSDPGTLKTQADQIAKTVMNGKGLQFNTPLAAQAFQSIDPCAFDKSIVADVTTKTMGAFEHCTKVNQWLVSAGAPATPTPIGEFHVYAKFSVQDMRGTNPNGTPYFQPSVPWVNYFYAGSAIHGVYWHPLSWFGVNNSSHGCVGVPVDEAQWIYNWAPIGTTVITTDKPDLNFMSS